MAEQTPPQTPPSSQQQDPQNPPQGQNPQTIQGDIDANMKANKDTNGSGNMNGTVPQKWPYARLPTIKDLRIKLCWICREEETIDQPSNRTWVHPCKCTLVAHESCLLTWIAEAQSQPSRAASALNCPQCNTKYRVDSYRPPMLRFLDQVSTQASKGTRILSVVVIGSGVMVCLMTYGAHALRCFVGPTVTHLTLGDSPASWPWHAYLNLPIIPVTLISTKISYFDIISPLSSLFFFAPHGLFPNIATSQTVTYPPSAPLTFALLPPLRAAYSFLYQKLAQYVMRAASSSNSRGYNRQRLPILPPAQNPADAQPAARANGNANGHAIANNNNDNNNNDNDNDNDNANPEAEIAADINIRVNGINASRTIVGTLFLPTVSRIMGELLLTMSHSSEWLRDVLGITAYRRNMNVMGRTGILNIRMGVLGTRVVPTWEELDPVWWRNSIGLCLFVLVRDSFSLYHFWLKQREQRSRRIMESEGFQLTDLNELDLVF